MGIGVHSIVVNVDAFGYEPRVDTFDVTVDPIPTSVIVDGVMYNVFPYDSVTVSFTWMDDKNTLGLGGFVPVIIWPDTFNIVDHANGTYSIELDTTNLHVGTYYLNVTFTGIGYVDGTRSVSVEMLELPIVMTFDDVIEQFENETITVSISMYDGPHATVVDWGEIIIELEGVQYPLVYDSGIQEYSVDIWLGSRAPGTYTLNFTASAIDCEIEYGLIQLEIMPKTLYELVLEVDTEVQAGGTIHISVLATNASTPVEGLTIDIHVLLEGLPLTIESVMTDVDGIATLEFQVPGTATDLTIWAEFMETMEEWAAVSNTVNREVSPAGIDILAFIISLLEDPVTLTLIVGGCGAVAGLVVLRRRRRGGTPSSSAADSIVDPTPTPSAPIGEMDIMQDKIKGSVDGLTRAQIAQSLEISTSKARAMVKKLLESDTAFEEVKEGRLRRIRFRRDE
jgi:hypothetical protein